MHRLRAEHDAVVVGIETALTDDPELTVRLHGYDGPQPARVVLDSRQRLPVGSKLVQTPATSLPMSSPSQPAPDLLAGRAICRRSAAGETAALN